MTTEEARKWAELYAAIADGKTWQITTAPSVWRDACKDDNPRGWRVERLRIKPEPQIVYVATWFEDDGKVRSASASFLAPYDPEYVLKRDYGDRPGFRVDTIERELP